jgi:AcrR family transcriptional regulator
MKANTLSPDKQPTVTEIARRSQIVEAAIATIAELGYPKASFAQIAKRAGLSSTGLISYHFANKEELNFQIVTEIVGSISSFMTERMAIVADPQEALVAYIENLIAFMCDEGVKMRALSSIFLHGGFAWEGEQEGAALEGIERILRWGQETGVFRQFDVPVMATTIQRSLDGIPFAQIANPGLDLALYARELVETFTRATRLEVTR